MSYRCLAVTAVTLAIYGSGSARVAGAQSPHAARDTSTAVMLNREVFQYSAAGHRDPFVSLLNSSDLRPTLADLRLTTVMYDPTGGNSVAVLRNIGTKEQYRVKVGSTLGRMRVVRIDPKVLTFALEEFGFSRQETISLNDSTSTTSSSMSPSTRTP